MIVTLDKEELEPCLLAAEKPREASAKTLVCIPQSLHQQRSMDNEAPLLSHHQQQKTCP